MERHYFLKLNSHPREMVETLSGGNTQTTPGTDQTSSPKRRSVRSRVRTLREEVISSRRHSCSEILKVTRSAPEGPLKKELQAVGL